MTTSRTDFNETWLKESPAKLGDFGDTFSTIQQSIKEWIADGHTPEQLQNGLFRLRGENIMYYWYQNEDDIIVAAELEKRPQGYAVTTVGKNPLYMKNPPYATDLYQAILPTVPYSLLFSDAQLSNDGINLWKKLMTDSNNVVSVYDYKNPGKSFVTLNSPDELDQFMGNYYHRFVLSKKAHTLAETRSYFNTRRYRELAGLSLTE